jgi:hypothetical protein
LIRYIECIGSGNLFTCGRSNIVIWHRGQTVEAAVLSRNRSQSSAQLMVSRLCGSRDFPPPTYVFMTPFTTVRNDIPPVNGRTDQAVMTRQELIKLQRTIGFSQSLLQYLGTFSREQNRPAPDSPRLQGGLAAARWDMNNLQE